MPPTKNIELLSQQICEIIIKTPIDMSNLFSLNDLYQNIYQIIQQAQKDAYQSINVVMLQTYWSIGKHLC